MPNWMDRLKLEKTYMDRVDDINKRLAGEASMASYMNALRTLPGGGAGTFAEAQRDVTRTLGEQRGELTRSSAWDLSQMSEAWRKEDEANAEIEKQKEEARKQKRWSTIMNVLGTGAGLGLAFATGGAAPVLTKIGSGLAMGGAAGKLLGGLSGAPQAPSLSETSGNVSSALEKFQQMRDPITGMPIDNPEGEDVYYQDWRKKNKMPNFPKRYSMWETGAE